ncbi:MAG: hypothetical protein ACRDGF_11815, partial [Chloroflexota bacterium]
MLPAPARGIGRGARPSGPVIFNRLWLLVLLAAVDLGVWRHLPLLIVGGLLGLGIGGAQLLWGRFCLSGVEYERHLG